MVTEREKTGTHVAIPLNAAIAEEILAVSNSNPKYLFFDRRAETLKSLLHLCGSRIAKVLETARDRL